MVKLKAFSKFENTSEALEAATLLIDGKASKEEGVGSRAKKRTCLAVSALEKFFHKSCVKKHI